MRSLFALVVAVLLGCTALAQTQPADTRREPVVNVMSFNIRYGKAQDGENRWQKRREILFDVIREHRPDAIGLQEALRFQLDELRKALPEYDEIGVGREAGQDGGEYNTILYRAERFEVLERGNFWYSDTPEVPGSRHWGNMYPRLCTWGCFAFKARPAWQFYLYNTHLDHISQPSREKSARLLAARIRARSHAAPVIVTGDFNADESNPVLHYLTGAGAASRPSGDSGPADTDAGPRLLDTFRALHPDAREVGTFHGFDGRRTNPKIDYILVSRDVTPLRAEILHDNRTGRYPSDHFPILAVLRLPSGG